MKTSGISGSAKTVTFDDLGSITLTPGASKTIAAADISNLDTDLDYYPPDATKKISAAPLEAEAAKTALIKAAKAAGAGDGDITIEYNDGADAGSKFELKVNGTVVATADETSFATNGIVFKDKNDNTSTIATITATGLTATDFTGPINTGLTYTAPGTAANSSLVDYNKSTTDITNVALGSEKRLASTRVTVTKDMIQDGGSFKIGTKTYTFKTKKTGSAVSSSTTDVVDVSDLDSTSSSYISDVLTKLTDVAVNNTTYTVGHDNGNTFTVTEKDGQTDFANGGKSTLTSKEAIAATLGYRGVDIAADSGKSLTLQIGDTSDSWNQLSVDIKDCHVDALGIGANDMSIASQEDASKAVDLIKKAINYVSDVRGDLGATQNRLDHTINNLSVMQENIQDAESTIRDVDVAKEMMAYTKNNILVQSAQANQLPQGVLQLLG